MDEIKVTKTNPVVTKNTLPTQCPTSLHGWLKYDFGKPLKPTEKPTMVLTLEYILSDFKREIINSSYEIKFEYTTLPIYNPMQICQIFHRSIEIGIEDFKIQFIKEGFTKYPLHNIIAPSFEQAFAILKELYYPPDVEEN